MSDLGEKHLTPELIAASSGDYAGDISVTEAWRVLSLDAGAVMVDVRTRAEWSFVGLPDLSSLGKQALTVEWQSFPGMGVNQAFADELETLLAVRPGKQAPVLFLCRSGARSRSAATLMTSRGVGPCYNVAGGFEGDLDAARHRGGANGWKAAGLPWVQS